MSSKNQNYSVEQLSSKDANSSLDQNSLTKLRGEEMTEELKIEQLITETRPWYRVSHLRRLVLAIVLISMTPTITGYDGSMLNGLQSLPHWREAMGNPEGYILGNLSNGPIFGGILCIPFAPYFCDHFGRRVALCTGATIAVIGGILQGVSNSYGFFLGSRCILGFGGYLVALASPVLISEIAYPTHRETATFAYNLCWYFGAIAAAWVTYATRVYQSNASWKIPSYLQALLPSLQVAFIWIIPESPRYYVSRGKIDEARAVLSKFHTGDSTDPRDIKLVDFELRQIEVAIELEKLETRSSYLDFVTKKNFRKRLMICMFVPVMQQLSGNALVSFYLAKVLISIGITDLKDQLIINGCLMIYNFVICCTLASVVRFLKRRTMLLTCIPGMLVCFVIWTILSAKNQQTGFAHKPLANGVLAMIFFYYLFYDIGLNGLPSLYMTETLPFSHRAKGFNIYLFTTMVVSVYNGYVNAIAMYHIQWKYYIVFCGILTVELIVVYFWFPETSGYTLEEVGQVFGDEPPVVTEKNGVIAKRESISQEGEVGQRV